MGNLYDEFVNKLKSALVDKQNHYFLVPRRIGATTLLKNLSNEGKGIFEQLEELNAESIILNTGYTIIVGSGSFYQNSMNSLETEAKKHVLLLSQ